MRHITIKIDRADPLGANDDGIELAETAKPVAAHTPGPYHLKDDIRGELYIESEHEFICDMELSEAESCDVPKIKSTAEYICRACNSHEEMLAALKLMMRGAGEMVATGGQIAAAQAALAKAEGRAE